MLDGPGQQADANAPVQRKPEVAKWAVVLFTIISVYIGNLLISWPVNSPGQYFRKELGQALGTMVVQYMNTWQVSQPRIFSLLASRDDGTCTVLKS